MKRAQLNGILSKPDVTVGKCKGMEHEWLEDSNMDLGFANVSLFRHVFHVDAGILRPDSQPIIPWIHLD